MSSSTDQRAEKIFLYSYVSVPKFNPIWCLHLNLYIWLTCEPASCHPMQCAGWSPGASVYNPPACIKRPRVQSQVLVAMRTVKQQGNRAAATRFLRSWIFQNGRMKLSCWWYVCLFLSHCRFHLDVFLSNRRCTVLFEFSSLRQFIQRQFQKKNPHLQICSFPTKLL